MKPSSQSLLIYGGAALAARSFANPLYVVAPAKQAVV
jgi:hypothetical protein